MDYQRFGVFNGGFMAVGPAGGPFLSWMEEMVRRDCIFCERP